MLVTTSASTCQPPEKLHTARPQMRRAADQLLRTTKRAPVGRLFCATRCSAVNANRPRKHTSFRSVSSFKKNHGPLQTLQSAMYLRQFSVAAFASLVASGLWYYRADPDQKRELVDSPTTTRHLPFSAPTLTVSRSLRNPVVEDDQYFIQELASSGPIIKSADPQPTSPHAMLTPEEATQKLRHLQESYQVLRGRGVLRYDVVQLPSNNPIEDDHAEKLIETSPSASIPNQTSDSTTSDWMFWSVFDGHGGWTTSAKLRQVLTSYVVRELNAAYKSALAKPSTMPPSAASIDAAIKQGFLKCDHEIVHEAVTKAQKANTKSAAADLLGPALSGSCALLSFYDSRSKDFRVACSGDSRAVLGRRNPNGIWTAQALSEDQTGGTPSEIARLRAEHPGEPNVVAHGRILGNLEPSRAFGDAHYKWAKDIQEMVKKNWFGRNPLTLLKTPPYVTAEPVVTTTKVMPEKGDFVVLATDGLWEMLTNEEVVGLVGKWLEQNPVNAKITASASSSWTQSFLGGRGKSDASLPVNRLQDGNGQTGQRSPIRRQQWDITAGDERFVVEDKNAATHLVRNALGGRDRDMLCGLLTLPSPYSRRYRDDLTIEVIFFGEGEAVGDVVANVEASAPRNARPKL
ncbi:MAG: hypothetical protein Q9209_006671 [Squamulea sp. 1 TL-2023]